MKTTKCFAVSLMRLLFLLPSALFAQSFTDVAEQLCQEGKRGFVIFGDNGKVSSLVKSQPELKDFIVYELPYNSEIGKRVGVDRPMMYAFNKNMVLVDKQELSSRGWKEIKKNLKFRLSKDCMMVVEDEPAVVVAETEFKPTHQVSEVTHKELERMLVEDTKPKPEPKKEEKKEVIPLSPSSHSGESVSPQRFWTVQIGAYGTEERAQNKIKKSVDVPLGMKVVEKRVVIDGENKKLYAVCAGQFPERQSAKVWAGKLNGFVYEIW